MTIFPLLNPANSHGNVRLEPATTGWLPQLGDDRVNCSAGAGKNFRGAAWMDMPPQHREGLAPVATSGFSERHTDSEFRTESLKTGAGFEPCRHGSTLARNRQPENLPTQRASNRSVSCGASNGAGPADRKFALHRMCCFVPGLSRCGLSPIKSPSSRSGLKTNQSGGIINECAKKKQHS